MTLPSGEVLRPDLALIDDPQTKKSAKSTSQCDDRYEIMMGDVLGMAGPGKSIAALCSCTVIYEDDLSDRILDRDQSRIWNGERCQMVYTWPKNETIWEEYRTIYETGDREQMNAFVADNFDQMHQGHHIAWVERKDESDLSAMQHAYHLRFRDEESFWAEYQNAPMSKRTDQVFELRVEDIASRIMNHQRNRIPAGCEKIIAQIDVQKHVLFYIVTAWTLGGRCHVINYGTWPDQKKTRFTKRQIRKTLSDVTGFGDMNESIYAGLESLVAELMGRDYHRTDGAKMSIDRLGVDCRWGYSTRTVRRFARETEYVGKVMPTMGQYVGAESKPWHKWSLQKGEGSGIHCRVQPPPKNQRGVRELLIDTNFWKSFVAERLLAGKGAEQSIVLFKAKPHQHRMLAEHCTCEIPTMKTGKSGMQLIEWTEPGSNAENDLWDCLVYSSALASLEGVRVMVDRKSAPKKKPKKRKRRVAALAC